MFASSSRGIGSIVLGKAQKQEHVAGLAIRNQRGHISSTHRKQTEGTGRWVRLQILKAYLR